MSVKINSLEFENVKRVKAVRIEPTANGLTVIGGRNGVYRKMSLPAGISLAIQGLLPMVAYIWYTGMRWDLIIFIPALVMYFLYLLIWHKLRGYTGDCCGAVCLLVELTVYLVVCTQ